MILSSGGMKKLFQRFIVMFIYCKPQLLLLLKMTNLSREYFIFKCSTVITDRFCSKFPVLFKQSDPSFPEWCDSCLTRFSQWCFTVREFLTYSWWRNKGETVRGSKSGFWTNPYVEASNLPGSLNCSWVSLASDSLYYFPPRRQARHKHNTGT